MCPGMRRCFVQCWTSGRHWQKYYGCSGVLAVLQVLTMAELQRKPWKITAQLKRSNAIFLLVVWMGCNRIGRPLTRGRSLVDIEQLKAAIFMSIQRKCLTRNQFPNCHSSNMSTHGHGERPHRSVQYCVQYACCLCVPVDTPFVASGAADLVAHFCSWNTWLTP
jgi:hypothetical protein